MPNTVRRAYVDTPVGQIHYRQAGEGAPILLVHQSWASSAMWDAVMPGFAERGFRPIALDLPGHGESDPGPVAPTIADYGRAVWAFVEALGLSPSPVVGHHSGSTLAVWLAVERPDWVTALAIWGVPVMTPEMTEKLATEQPHDWEHAETWLGPYWENRSQYSGPGWTPAISMRSLRDLIAAGPRNNEYHNAIAKTPIRDLLRKVRQPVLALAGDRDVLRDGSIEAAALAPNGRYVNIQDGGGDVVDHQTVEFVSAVADFLAGAV